MVNEFQFLSSLKAEYALEMVGDDCAVLPKDETSDLLITADLLIEDIDFRIEWTSPNLIGHKALAVSLSDMAAMGGVPKWAMLSIGVPEGLWNSSFLDLFYAGWFQLANEFGVELIGGDISRSPDKLVIDSIVGGEVARRTAILRSGAKAGELIAVTGALGGAAAGLRLLERQDVGERSKEWHQSLTTKQLEPQPQIAAGKLLHNTGLATSMIDVSDGLLSDLEHLCRQSGVGALIDAKHVPFVPDMGRAGMTSDQKFDLALNGGEDFELLFTFDPDRISDLDRSFFTVIGETTSNTGIIELIRDGTTHLVEPKGFRHF